MSIRAELLARLDADLAHALASPWPERVDCPICAGTIAIGEARHIREQALFTSAELVRIECPHCDVIFGPWAMIALRADVMSRLYELLYKVFAEGATIANQERAFYWLNPKRSGDYLNYACGLWLEGAKRLREVGWRIWGYEPHLDAEHLPMLRAAGVVTRLEDTGVEAFDGIITNNFLEHPQDPVAFFQTLHSLLKPNGAMVHATPCFDYRYASSPFHLYFFTGRSVAALCARTGFVAVERILSDPDDPTWASTLIRFAKA